MGYIRHDAIVVTSWNAEHLGIAREKAKELGMLVSEVVTGAINDYDSFLIAPDGSKEGWVDSDRGDEQRKQFTEWVKSQANRFYLDWIAVNFGGDDKADARIVDHAGNVGDWEE